MRYQNRIILISLFIMLAIVISQVPQINYDGASINPNTNQQSNIEPNVISAYPAPPTIIPNPISSTDIPYIPPRCDGHHECILPTRCPPGPCY